MGGGGRTEWSWLLTPPIRRISNPMQCSRARPAGWHVVGDADWKAQNGELIGTAKPGHRRAVVVMDKNFQDVQLYRTTNARAETVNPALLRARKTPDGGWLACAADAGRHGVALGHARRVRKEISRDPLTAPEPRRRRRKRRRAAGAPAWPGRRLPRSALQRAPGVSGGAPHRVGSKCGGADADARR